MPTSLDQIVPSLQAFGVGAYWVLMFAAMGEAVIFIGIILPGSMMVIAGGLLVRAGTIDFFDLAWFVAIGAIIGAEISYRFGRIGALRLSKKSQVRGSKYATKAKDMLGRYGGFSMVVSRFLGPVSAFVPFSWAMAGMPRRKFIVWNILSAVPYALVLPALGYFMADALALIGPKAGRVLFVLMLALAVFFGLWFVANRIRRNMAGLHAMLAWSKAMITGFGWIKRSALRWPGLARFMSHRFDTTRLSGLCLTLAGLAAAYLGWSLVVTATNVFPASLASQIDQRLAALLFALRDPWLIQVFSTITAFGDSRVVAALLFGVVLALALQKQWAPALGIALATFGNVLTVTILKYTIGRPRPVFAYYVETSGSFPSGHAAISVVFYGMLAFILWRQRRVAPVLALVFALVMAFGIGLSRLYLVEHYLSDVLNGAIIGALWLGIGVAVTEWWRARFAIQPRQSPLRAVPALPIAAAMIFAANTIITYAPAVTGIHPERPRLVATDAEIAASIAPATTSMTGTELAPIALVIMAPDMDAIIARLGVAGWAQSPAPGLAEAILAAFGSDAQDEHPTARAWVFWGNQPVFATFTRDDGAPGAGQTILRIWPVSEQLPDGTRAFAAAIQPAAPTGPDQALRAVAQDIAQPGPSVQTLRVLALQNQ
ncbi:bifunctional DedA family/phosphatase PAP2 family protein [Abyssibius alkaniclasticus]|uniref:bifunctional DedA family/phosphatase PAP2 family protein n=1 Tax=Abyssibius alkaniclasticus TaxID=2881234 RepID=UPI00405A0735